MIRLIYEMHHQWTDGAKWAVSLMATFTAAITAQQESVAWAAQVFMWLSAGTLSLLSAVSITIKLLRQWGRKSDDEK